MSAGALSFLTDEPRKAAPGRISSTTLGAAERCMLLAKLDRENPAGSAPASAGRVFHEAAATIATFAYARDLSKVSVQDALAIANQVIRHPEEPTGLARHDANHVRGMIARWARWTEFEIDADVFAVEVPMVTELEGVLFSARIDRLAIKGTHCKITDYKTGQHVPTVKEVEEHSQLPSYAVHAFARWPFLLTFELEEVYTVRQPVPRPVWVEDTHIPALEDWMLDVHGRITEAYEHDDFEAAPGPWCQNCPAVHACPVPPEARPESIQSLDDAVSVAGRLVVNVAAVADDRTALKSYLGEHEIEALHVGGARVGWEDGERRELNKDRLQADRGLDLEEYYDVRPERKFKVAGR